MTDFNNLQIKMFRKLFAHPPESNNLGNPEEFILRYVFFEALARQVGHYYRERSKGKKKQTGHESLDKQVVKSSLNYFCIQISDPLINNLLDSQRVKRNDKSARNLRNALVHQWKSEDREEVGKRFNELNNQLSQAIESIKIRVDNSRK
jgi:hypothetical protein